MHCCGGRIAVITSGIKQSTKMKLIQCKIVTGAGGVGCGARSVSRAAQPFAGHMKAARSLLATVQILHDRLESWTPGALRIIFNISGIVRHKTDRNLEM
jgi:hypothetical protein